MVGGTHLLLAAVVPALVSSYQIGFQETMAIPNDPDSRGSPIEFTQYSNEDDDIDPPCLEAPRFPSGQIERVHLRNGPLDLRPPLAMAFFNSYLEPTGPNTPPASACVDENFLFAVRWHPSADSEQTFTPPDGSFTNFREIRERDADWSYVKDISDGDIVYRDFTGDSELFRGAVTYESLFISDSPALDRVPVMSQNQANERDYSEYTVEEQAAYDSSLPNEWYNTAPNSASLGHSRQYVTPPGGQADSDSAASETLLGSQPGGRVPVADRTELHHNLLELMGFDELPADAFNEQFHFERNYPDFFQMLVDQFTEGRQGAMAHGMYVPIPLGLLLRYTDEELNAMGLGRDAVREIDAWTLIRDARAEDPEFGDETPLLFRMFEGRTPGVFQTVFNRFISTLIAGMRREDREAEEAAGVNASPENVAEGNVASGYVSPFQMTEPSVQGQADSIADSNWMGTFPADTEWVPGQAVVEEEDLTGTDPLGTPNIRDFSNLGSPEDYPR
ncbi:hypothetical protein TWF696_007917 [Orbilia brochopaga]|uniref:Uncharacterized protein n=1 Tax=Orbilia brochopaga TaxID=3140254 RepID=A0AAV9UQ11_9PEZI